MTTVSFSEVVCTRGPCFQGCAGECEHWFFRTPLHESPFFSHSSAQEARSGVDAEPVHIAESGTMTIPDVVCDQRVSDLRTTKDKQLAQFWDEAADTAATGSA